MDPNRRNYPATKAEAEAMLETSTIGGYKIERIGDLINPPPEPLPRRFAERFAASVASNPRLFGRLFIHAIRAVRKEEEEAGRG